MTLPVRFAFRDEVINGPDVDLDGLLTVHRYPDGYIGFTRKTPTGFQNLFAIQTRELRSMLPGIAGFLLEDAYHTVNDYYAPAPWTNRTTGLPDVRRKEKYLSKLTACYCDVDVGREESQDLQQRLTWREVAYLASIYMDAGIIPQASIFARSGRGVYLLWLLHDPTDKTGFQSAWPEKIEFYKQVNKALGEQLRTHAWLPVDLRAFDAARVLRVPGSVHSATGRRVTYWPQLDQHGKPFFYTLAELADFLQLGTPDLSLPDSTHLLAAPATLQTRTYRKTKQPGAAPNRGRGMVQLNAKRAQDLVLVLQHRNGIFKRGMKYPDGLPSPGRQRTLAFMAGFLHDSNTPKDKTLDSLKDIANNATPVYPSDDNDTPVRDLVEYAYSHKMKRITNARLCRLYGITPDMARELDLRTILPAEVKAERLANRTTRRERRQDACEYLREYIEANHHWPSTRTAAKVLTDAGYATSHETARKLLKTLQLCESPHAGEVHVEHRPSP